jgi:hypothetical protein
VCYNNITIKYLGGYMSKLKKCKNYNIIVLKGDDPYAKETRLMETKIPYMESKGKWSKGIPINKKYHKDRIDNNIIAKLDCNKCLEALPYYEFSWKNSKKRGRHGSCRACAHKYYLKHKQKYIDNQHTKWENNYLSKFRTLVAEQIKRDIRTTTKQYDDVLTEEIWDLLPYTPAELCQHLEEQFEPWMNWKNHSKKTKGPRWEIDHIKPRNDFPFESINDPQMLDCWALSNIRPLEWSKNATKGDS